MIIFRGLNIYVRQLSRMTASENGRLSKLLIQILQAFKYLAATNQIKVLSIEEGQTLVTASNLEEGVYIIRFIRKNELLGTQKLKVIN